MAHAFSVLCRHSCRHPNGQRKGLRGNKICRHEWRHGTLKACATSVGRLVHESGKNARATSSGRSENLVWDSLPVSGRVSVIPRRHSPYHLPHAKEHKRCVKRRAQQQGNLSPKRGSTFGRREHCIQRGLPRAVRRRQTASRDDLADHSALDVGEAVIAATMAVGEPRMVESHQVQNRGV